MKPLLSICIPTYDRAERLRVMLQAVLPQVAEHADKVELWISDNASPDHTPQVVEEARRLGPLQYSRNATNLGIVANIITLANELARGEYVWVLGDDDLLRPKALARVLAALEAHSEMEILNLNFRYTLFEAQWPDQASGGYDGPFDGLGNPELSDRVVEQWYELVSAQNSMCGQVYVHVVRRSVWQNYWQGRPRQQDFSDTRWSYPHSYMIAETLMHSPSFYVGEPVLTIFNGGESWRHKRHVAVLLRYPGLLRVLQRNGLPERQVRDCAQMVFSYCEPLLVEIMRGEAGKEAPGIGSYLRTNWRFAEAWHALARASHTAGSPWVLSSLFSAVSRLSGKLTSAMSG
ncbi:MAG TPA: glycosyltransferase family 2 protein [Pyrinomonadaceae bacterium]|nr:glycosyltransferase family 2 protein [Pyrinomonadaceae bacterium]